MHNTSVALAVIPPELAQMRPADHRVTFDDSVDSEENDDRNEILMGPDTSRLQSAQTVNTPISKKRWKPESKMWRMMTNRRTYQTTITKDS